MMGESKPRIVRFPVQKEVIRQLVTEYQQDRNESVFGRLLKRLDSLVISKVNQLKNQYFYYDSNITFDEIYQTAIVGFGEGLLSMRDEDDGDACVIRILSYIKAAVRRTFKPVREITGGGISDVLLNSQVLLAEDFVERTDLLDFIQVCFNSLSEEEKKLIHLRFFKGCTYIEIGEEIGCTRFVARDKVLKIIVFLKRKFGKSF